MAYVPTSQLSEEARQARNAYYREWRRNHKEAVSRANARHWEKKAEERRKKDSDGANA